MMTIFHWAWWFQSVYNDTTYRLQPQSSSAGTMKSRMSKPQFRRAINCIVLMSLVLLPLYAGNLPSVHAQGTNAETPTAAPQSREVILVPGTVAVGDEIQKAVIVALENAADLSPNTIYFAITDLRLEGSWALASVIGLAQVHAGLVWSIEDGSWIGLVILKQGQDGKWEGGTQGTPRFSSLIDEAPDQKAVFR